MANIPTINSSGELSPQLDARSDYEKYGYGCRHCENFLPTIYGCAERRPGTQLVSQTIDLDTILPSIVSWQNVEVCYENEVVSTLPDTAVNRALIPVFVCYENLITCWENRVVVESQTAILSENIVCYENKPVFYENIMVEN